MKRKNRNGKEPHTQSQNPSALAQPKWFDITFPAADAMRLQFTVNAADQSIVITQRRKRPGAPRRNAQRDERIVYMHDVGKYSFGEIAQKLKIGREVAASAYRRMKKQTPRGTDRN